MTGSEPQGLIILDIFNFAEPDLGFRRAGFGISPSRILKCAEPDLEFRQAEWEIANFLSC